MADLTREEMANVVTEFYGDQADDVMRQIDGWLADGRSVALYQNAEFGHPEMGAPKIGTCGPEAAQFPGEPPTTFPDMPGEINWRYQLTGVLRHEN